MKDDLTGILRLFADKGHWTAPDQLDSEMEEGGYELHGRHEFLPLQNFVVFEAGGEG